MKTHLLFTLFRAEIEGAYEKLDRDTKALIDKDAGEMATLSKNDFLPV